MIVSWYSVLIGTADGYGTSADRMIRGLTDAGVDVRVEPGYGIAGETTIPDVLAKPFVQGDVRIIYAPPLWKIPWGRSHPNQAVLGMTMWESNYTPDSWRESLRNVDAVAAPSRFCADLFQPYCSDPVQLVPLGVDHAFLAYRRRKRTGPFVVLHTASGMQDPRKGAREAYLAFAEAYQGRDDVRLILRAQAGDVDVNGDRRVEKRVGYITESQKRELLYEAHVYLYPSMGEGLGLMPLEAIATGLPVIASRSTGMMDYAPLFYGVECDPVPSGNRTPTIPSDPNGQWMKPRHAQLVAELRNMESRYGVVSDVAWASAQKLRADWGWDKTIVALRSAIDIARTRQRLRIAVSA